MQMKRAEVQDQKMSVVPRMLGVLNHPLRPSAPASKDVAVETPLKNISEKRTTKNICRRDGSENISTLVREGCETKRSYVETALKATETDERLLCCHEGLCWLAGIYEKLLGWCPERRGASPANDIRVQPTFSIEPSVLNEMK